MNINTLNAVRQLINDELNDLLLIKHDIEQLDSSGAKRYCLVLLNYKIEVLIYKFDQLTK